MKKKTVDKNNIFKSDSFRKLKENAREGMFSELFSDWKWIFGYVKKHLRLIILYLFAGIIASTTSVLYSYSIKMLINRIVSKEYQRIILLALILLFSVALNLVFRAVSMRIVAKVSIGVNNDIQSELFNKIFSAKWEDVNGYKNGDIINRFNDDVRTISQNAVSWLPDMVINLYTFVLTFVILWRIDVVMSLISIMAAPIMLLISRVLLKRLHKSRKDVTELNSDMISFETDTLNNYEMIKSFGIHDFYTNQMKKWHGEYEKSNLEYNKNEIKARISMSLTSSVITIIALGYCFLRLSTGTLLYGDMTFFLAQRNNVSNRFNSLLTAIPGVMNSAVSAHRIRELMSMQTEQSDRCDINTKKTNNGISIEINHIGFSYQKNNIVYEDGSLCAYPGEIVSIIGMSGEGKTTLLRLLLGLVTPNKGDIILHFSDGTQQMVTTDVRKYISYVPQGGSTILGTIADNMRIVKENASDEEIIEALKIACAWDFVKDMPKGINTYLGDNASGISKGQAQRISIARAILRKAPILILDEATSALDIETEQEVLKNIVSSCPNKTCIVSTHRTSIIGQSDRVYRIKNKKIIEIKSSKSE